MLQKLMRDMDAQMVQGGKALEDQEKDAAQQKRQLQLKLEQEQKAAQELLE